MIPSFHRHHFVTAESCDLRGTPPRHLFADYDQDFGPQERSGPKGLRPATHCSYEMDSTITNRHGEDQVMVVNH